MDFGYNDVGQFDSIKRYAGLGTSAPVANTFYDYDGMGRLKTLLHTTATDSPLPLTTGWGSGTLAGYKFAYDAASRLTSIDSNWDGVSTYNYDFTSQLTSADHAAAGSADELCSYDANGNRTITGYATGMSNLLQSDGVYSYLYDAEGNRLRRTHIATQVYTTYTYDHRNRLIGVQDVDPSAALAGVEGWGDASDSGVWEPEQIGWGSSSGTVGGYAVSTSGMSEDSGYLGLTVFVNQQVFIEYSFEAVSAVPGVDFSAGAGSCTVNESSGTECQVAYPIDDEAVEWTESFEIHVWIAGQPETEIVLEGQIGDDDATGSPPASISYEALVSPAVEGENVLLTVAANPAWTFEYWVEDVSAVRGTDYTDPDSSSSTYWVPIGAGGQVSFPTMALAAYGGTRSFAIHVRLAGMSSTEIVLEADIFDFEDTIVQTVEYAYDVFSQLVRRAHDDDGPHYPLAPTEQFFVYDDGQIVLQFDGTQAADLSHRYLWGVAVDQLLADETVTSLTSAGAVRWPLADHLGTIRDIAQRAGGVTFIVNHRKYDSFGNLKHEMNTTVDLLFGFTGRLFDEATGLQNNLHRWYDPRTAKWTTEDPLGFAAGDANLGR